jgi:DNA-binding LacI/PurR family transcriptional regulator
MEVVVSVTEVLQSDKASRIDQVREGLLQMAIARGPGIKLPTVRELCAQFDVPFRTLEHAIIQLEQRQMLTRRQGSGIYATEQVRQKTIGVVFGGDIFAPWFSPFWSLLMGAVRGQAGESKVQPRAYFDIDDGHSQLVEDLEAHRLDGLLLLSPRHDRDEAAELRAYGLPLVMFGGKAPVDWTVTFDWDQYFELAAVELVALEARRIGLLAPPAQRPALEQALRQLGRIDIQIDDWSYETWAETIPYAGTRENLGHLLTQHMIANRAATPLPDALVSMDDTATRGTITALLAAGLQPGRDMRIITGENKGSPVLDPWAANLTRIVFDPQAWAKAALEMLETLMNGRTPKQNPVQIAPQAERRA